MSSRAGVHVKTLDRVQLRLVKPPPAGEQVRQVTPMLLKGEVNRAEIASASRFAVADRVRMRRDNPPTHTRLPNYVRGCAGTVTAAHGGFAFADAQARGRIHCRASLHGPFRGSRGLGRNADDGCAVYLDLYESYMDKTGLSPTCRGAPAPEAARLNVADLGPTKQKSPVLRNPLGGRTLIGDFRLKRGNATAASRPTATYRGEFGMAASRRLRPSLGNGRLPDFHCKSVTIALWLRMLRRPRPLLNVVRCPSGATVITS